MNIAAFKAACCRPIQKAKESHLPLGRAKPWRFRNLGLPEQIRAALT
jgi:hypothetical protein